MVRQAPPISADMHVVVQHLKSAHVNAIQAQYRQPGRKTACRFSVSNMKHIMYIQLAGQGFTHLIAPIIEITRNNQRRIMRYLFPRIFDQCAGLRAPAFGEQAEMNAQAMNVPLAG